VKTDDEDVGEVWLAVKGAQQEKRAANREASPQLLTDAGIPFEAKNGGAHLIVGAGLAWDFWPGTGLWRRRGPVKGNRAEGYGVRRLIERIKRQP
jgi:hypothetical protein